MRQTTQLLKLKIKELKNKHTETNNTITEIKNTLDFPGGSEGKVSVYNTGDLGSIPGSGTSWRRKRQPTPVLLPRKSYGQRSLVSMGSQRVEHD